MKLFFSLFLVNCAQKHTAGVNSHHCSGRQVDNSDKSFADKLFGLIIGMNTAQDNAVGARAVIEDELEQLLALGHCGAFFDLNGSEIGLAESLEIDKILEERLYLNFREVYSLGSLLLFFLFDNSCLLGRVAVERLHRREEQNVAD